MLTVRESRHEDSEGIDWQIAALTGAKQAADSDQEFEVPALPDWQKSEAVSREVLGHYALIDGVVHSVRDGKADCGIDSARNLTWVHFFSEVRELHPDALCHDCISEPPEGES